MEVYKTPLDAALYITSKKGVNRFYTDRIRDMISHVTLSDKPSCNSTRMSWHNVKIDRVAKSWPMSGSIYLTRDDGKRYKLYMTKKEFKVELV